MIQIKQLHFCTCEEELIKHKYIKKNATTTEKRKYNVIKILKNYVVARKKNTHRIVKLLHFDSKHKEIIIQKPKRANISSENNTNFFMAFKTWQKSTMFFLVFFNSQFFFFYIFFNVITFYDFAEFLWWLWLCDCLDDVP